MASQIQSTLREVAGIARDVAARVRPGALEGRRSLPIRRSPDDIRRLWTTEEARTAVLDGLPASAASIDVGGEQADWGTVTTLELRLDAPMPGVATQTLAGKAVRRLKALAETGEVPTTDHNPAARPDAGETA